MRCLLAEVPAERVLAALGGPPVRDAAFHRLLALAGEKPNVEDLKEAPALIQLTARAAHARARIGPASLPGAGLRVRECRL